MTESSRSCKGGPAGGLPRLRERGRPVSEEVRSRAVLAVVEEGMTVSAAAGGSACRGTASTVG